MLQNEKVSESKLTFLLQEQCKSQVKGRKVLSLCDTCTISLENSKNRLIDYDGLGNVGKNQYDHQSLGFHVHPILIYDRTSKVALGISEVELINRPIIAARKKSERWKTKDIPIEEKESYKWIGPCLRSMENALSEVSHVTFVMDREGDIMDVFDKLKSEKSDVLVRSMHNRKVINQQGEQSRINDELAKQEVQCKTEIEIKGKKRKSRKAKLDVKFTACELQWPLRQKVKQKLHPKGITVSIIEVRETNHKGYQKEPPLAWKLITTEKVETVEQALEQIENYKQRWEIEVFFKLLKTDGFNIEATELTTGKAIRKLTLFIMKASVKILQLKAARSGSTDVKTDEIFNEKEIECLEKLNDQLEGQTRAQQNPYDRNHLSWASWVIARLGGWKSFYDKNRPPGNKSFVWGLEKFESIMIGYNILNKKDVS